MIEREIRFKIDEKIKESIINSSELLEEKSICIDLCMGRYGFDSLDKLGYIIRLRNKNGKNIMECKRKIEDNKWNEMCIPLENMKVGYDFLNNLELKPYLYINRKREIRTIKQANICIDEVDLLGTYVEFEMKDGFEFEDLSEYLKQNGITNKPVKLYGDIFKEKIEDDEFRIKFEDALKEYLKNN